MKGTMGSIETCIVLSTINAEDIKIIRFEQSEERKVYQSQHSVTSGVFFRRCFGLLLQVGFAAAEAANNLTV